MTAVTLKIMRSFVPSAYRFRKRPSNSEEEYFVSLIPGRFMGKILKLIIAVVVLVAVVVLGNFAWLVLQQYAILVNTKVPPPQELTYDVLKQSLHYEQNRGVATVQDARIKKVVDGCRIAKEPKFLSAHQKKSTYSRIFVDHNHKFAYCSVPKAACTKWKQIILKSSGIGMYEDKDISSIFPHYDYQFKRLSDLDTIKALQVLNNYYVFTFVRDPLVRLVSAWKDKFQHHANENRSDYVHFHHEFGRNIMKRFRKGGFTADELERGFPISFSEYIEYITSFSNPEEMNEHWAPATTLCRPCHIDYHFVGKFEHQKIESEFLIDSALSIERYVPEDFFTEPNAGSRNLAKILLAGLPERQRRVLAEIYQDDAKLFGYDLMEFLEVTRLSNT